jgi:hypothetical protein
MNVIKKYYSNKGQIKSTLLPENRSFNPRPMAVNSDIKTT